MVTARVWAVGLGLGLGVATGPLIALDTAFGQQWHLTACTRVPISSWPYGWCSSHSSSCPSRPGSGDGRTPGNSARDASRLGAA